MDGSRNRSTPTLSPQEGNENLRFIGNTFDHNDTDKSGVSDSSGDSRDEDGLLGNPNPNCRQIQQNNSNTPSGPEGVSLKVILKGITIEPMMFAHMFALCTTSVVLQNLYIERICKISLQKGDEVCDNLSLHNETEQEIDAIAPKFAIYRSLIETGFPIIMSLFLGPWMEIHGTKKPMILPIFGFFLSAVSYLILTHIPSVPPGLLLISSIPISIVGGLVSILMSSFSFISKLTSVETRSFRIAMLEGASLLGVPLGTLNGGLVYKYGGYSAVFATSATLFLAAFIYGCIIIREELPDIEDRENRHCCTDMCNVQAVKDMFSAVFQKRNGPRRRLLLVMLFTNSLRTFAWFGYLPNMYLYTRTKFSWEIQQYTEYSVSNSFITIASGFIMIMTCTKIFKLPDAIIGILSTVGIVASQFVFAFSASNGWMLYVGSSLQMFAGLINIVLWSMISKIVAKEEIARVFTIVALGEVATTLIGVPLYSYIFSDTIQTFPGAMFMLSAAVYMIILINFIYLYISMRNVNDYVQVENPTESSA